MSMDQLKTQLMTIFAIKGGNNDSIMSLIYGMILLSILDQFIKSLPVITTFLTHTGTYIFKKHVVIPKITSDITARIIFEQYYNNNNKKEDNVTDAILDYICKQDNTTDLIYNKFYIANKENSFDLSSDIKVKIIEKNFKEGEIQSIKFEIFSYTWNLTRLKKWINEIDRDFKLEKKNQFGEKRFFFDEVMPDKRIPCIHNLFFSMTEFFTNKSLSNIYGSHVDIVKARVKLFVENPEWYEKRGIPHTLGLLLHGPPGTGKTSLIKAIAKDTKRHIFNIKLRETTTPEQLSDLFYSENVKLKISNTTQSVIIPPNQRIYVIEDIDCLTKIVLDREENETKINHTQELTEPEWKDYSYSNEEPIKKDEKERTKLTLSFLLNLFDGVLETPGRILIMTSNYPEKLDKALIRPGRVDINLKLYYCDHNLVADMYKGFFNIVRDFTQMKKKDFTPAKIQEILCNNFNNYEEAYSVIIKNI